MSRRAGVLRTIPDRKTGLGRDEELIAPALDRGSQHLLGAAIRVNVSGIEQGDAGLQAYVNQPARICCAAVAPGREQRPLAAESAGAETQNRHLKSRCAKIPVFHDSNPPFRLPAARNT